MIELPKMNKSDIEKCGEIHFSAFYDEQYENLAKYTRDSGKSFLDSFNYFYYFSRFIDDYDKYALCIVLNGQIIGYITALEIPSFGNDNIIYIDSIAIAPPYQKQGYGKDALRQFMNMFPKELTKRLLTIKNKFAYKMYQQLGYMDMGMQVMENSEVIDRLNREKREIERRMEIQ